MDDRELIRFLKKVCADPNSGCWLWCGSVNNQGYGMLGIIKNSHKTTKLAHRLSYEHHVGPIPDGLHIDHLCRNTYCVNPQHLEAVTRTENVRRGNSGKWQTIKTHCPKGHPYEGDNLKILRSGSRCCRECLRRRHRISGMSPEKLEKERARGRAKYWANRSAKESVTSAAIHQKNAKRDEPGAWQKRKTHCPKGHEYTPENTKLERNGTARRCRECERARARCEGQTGEQRRNRRLIKKSYRRRKFIVKYTKKMRAAA